MRTKVKIMRHNRLATLCKQTKNSKNRPTFDGPINILIVGTQDFFKDGRKHRNSFVLLRLLRWCYCSGGSKSAIHRPCCWTPVCK